AQRRRSSPSRTGSRNARRPATPTPEAPPAHLGKTTWYGKALTHSGLMASLCWSRLTEKSQNSGDCGNMRRVGIVLTILLAFGLLWPAPGTGSVGASTGPVRPEPAAERSGATVAAPASATVFSGSGADPAAVQTAVNGFRSALGAINLNVK